MRKMIMIAATGMSLGVIAIAASSDAQAQNYGQSLSYGQYSRTRTQQQPMYVPGYEPRLYAPGYTGQTTLGNAPLYKPPSSLPGYMDTTREGLNNCSFC